jgi:hypothetical protein
VGGGPTNPHEVEQSFRVLRLRAVEDFLVVFADLIISAYDVYHEKLTIVLAFHPSADVTLIDSPSPTRYLIFCEYKVAHNGLLS